jgi:hypothetical protein
MDPCEVIELSLITIVFKEQNGYFTIDYYFLLIILDLYH